jgi:hypothetical protein
VASNPVTASENVNVKVIEELFVGPGSRSEVMATVGTELSYVYVADATDEPRPTWSQAMTLIVVVDTGIDTLVGRVDDAVPVEQVGSLPLSAIRNSLKFASGTRFC